MEPCKKISQLLYPDYIINKNKTLWNFVSNSHFDSSSESQADCNFLSFFSSLAVADSGS